MPDMKNVLIVYSSFSGSTAEIADSMKTYLEKENCIVDIKIADDKICDFTKYDFIILGSAIHGDNPHENILKFININRTELVKKQVAVFAVCITITSSKEKRKINTQTYPDKIANGLIPINKIVFA
jgi:menaquinone-dependent protoporphyrinogen IX oxidase